MCVFCEIVRALPTFQGANVVMLISNRRQLFDGKVSPENLSFHARLKLRSVISCFWVRCSPQVTKYGDNESDM